MAKRAASAAKKNVKKKTTRTKRTKKKAKSPAVSAVKGKTVAWYVETLEPWQQEIVQKIDSLIVATAPDVTSSIKWAQPVYELSGPFAFMRAAKKHVTFGFWRGTELSDPKELLEGAGSKMRHVKIRPTDEIKKNALKSFVKQAAKLNAAQGDPTKDTKATKKAVKKKIAKKRKKKSAAKSSKAKK